MTIDPLKLARRIKDGDVSLVHVKHGFMHDAEPLLVKALEAYAALNKALASALIYTVHGTDPSDAINKLCEQTWREALDLNISEEARKLRDTYLDKALRFDLDKAGIESRERDAVELVELRARVRELEAALAAKP